MISSATAGSPGNHSICLCLIVNRTSTSCSGLNEAGKSTALLAIEDLLFGIHPNSRLDFLHAYPDMRVGAVLQNDRETLEVRRRKGNKDTLLTPEEIPIPKGEGALAPFLAGANRGFIERMFSLDQNDCAKAGARFSRRETMSARCCSRPAPGCPACARH